MNGHDVSAARGAGGRASRRPSAAATLAWPCAGRRQTCRSCAGSSTIRRRAGWTAWRATPGSSARRPTCRASAGCCSAAAGSAPSRILSPATVARMTSPATPPEMRAVRGLGWDIDSSYLGEPRRAVSGRIVRAHRLHGHVAVARSGHEELRDLPVEPRPPRRQGRRDGAAREGRDGRGRARCCRRATSRATRRGQRRGARAFSATGAATPAQPPRTSRCSPASTCSPPRASRGCAASASDC
mgnify:CR=1 FL=1